MPEQIMSLRGEPIVIATIHGLIEIHRVVDGRHHQNRMLRIVLPDGVSACQDRGKALERTEWLKGEEGNVKPKHAAYVVDANGIKPQETIRLKIG